MKSHVISTTVITLLAFSPAILRAQTTGHDYRPRTERWVLSLSLGANFGGPAKAIERAMTASGFDFAVGGESLFGWFNTYYPKSKPLVGATIGIHYLIKPPLALGILAGYAQGETMGRHSHGDSWFSPYGTRIYLDVKYSILSFVPMLSFRASWCKLGVGGALHQIRTYTDHEKDKCWKLGLVLDTGLIVPFKDKPYFGELIFQYRGIGRFDIGPYTATNGDFSATFPASQVNYSHVFLGVGVGLRL